MVKQWTDLSVLIAGCGSIGKRHARVLRSLEVADVRGCDPSSAQRQSLSAESPGVRMYDSYDAGLRDRPDTVLLCTPPEMHVPMACQAIVAGCHVLTEKPLSDTLDGIDELERLAIAGARRSWSPSASATTKVYFARRNTWTPAASAAWFRFAN